MRQHNLYFPRFVPTKELHRIDWGLQLVSDYRQAYRQKLPVMPDPQALDLYLQRLLAELARADKILGALQAEKDAYHGHVSLKNKFLYGQDDSQGMMVNGSEIDWPALCGEQVSPGLFSRLVQLAYAISAHPACTDNIRKQLNIYNPGPARRDPALATVHPSDHNDGQLAKFYFRFNDPIEQVRIDCRYGHEPASQLVAITNRARVTDPRPFTGEPVLRQYLFTPLGKDNLPIGIVTEYNLVAVTRSVTGGLSPAK